MILCSSKDGSSEDLRMVESEPSRCMIGLSIARPDCYISQLDGQSYHLEESDQCSIACQEY